MNKAIFFDRDGVINNDTGLYYIWKPEDFKLNAGVIELLQWLKSEGYLMIIISNQGGIARNLFSMDQAEKVNEYLSELLLRYNLKFDEIYFCPHHPEYSKCLCRKPGTVSIEKAVSRFSINVEESFFIGDRDTDIDAAINAGLRPIKVEPNSDMSSLIKLIGNR